MAYNRDYMARMIISEKIHNNIIRICIDGIILDKKHDFKIDYKPIPEDKTTGSIFFVSSNKYYNQCLECKNFYKFKEYKKCPDCN